MDAVRREAGQIEAREKRAREDGGQSSAVHDPYKHRRVGEKDVSVPVDSTGGSEEEGSEEEDEDRGAHFGACVICGDDIHENDEEGDWDCEGGCGARQCFDCAEKGRGICWDCGEGGYCPECCKCGRNRGYDSDGSNCSFGRGYMYRGPVGRYEY